MPKLRADATRLAGATVVITRPAASARPIDSRVRALGGTPLGLPGVRVLGAHDARAAKSELQKARLGDVVVFISPSAVKFAFLALPRLRFPRAMRVCAMGDATARALRRKGVKNVLQPGHAQTSEGLLALPELQRLRGQRVTLIGAPGGRDALADALRARKARVAHAHVYRREPPRFRKAQLAALENASGPVITLLTSAEVLANLRAALPLALFGKLVAGELVVSSLRLAHAARASLFGAVHIAAAPSPDALVATACTALAHHRL